VKRDGGQRMVMFCTKMKDAPKPPDAVFDIALVEIAQTAEGVSLSGPALTKTAVAAVRVRAYKLAAHEQRVVAAYIALLEESGNPTDCAISREALKHKYFDAEPEIKSDTKRQRFNRALKNLMKSGILDESRAGLLLSPEFRRPDDTAFSSVNLRPAP